MLQLLPSLLFVLTVLPPPRSTLFPYTTLFRSMKCGENSAAARASTSGNCASFCASAISYGEASGARSALEIEEHTSELQSRFDLVCRLLLEKKKHISPNYTSTPSKQTCTQSPN